MKKVSIVACVLLLATAAVAQGPPSSVSNASANAAVAPRATIVVKLNGLSCTTAAGTNMFNVLSWFWGASSPVSLTGGGGTTGRPDVSGLTVRKKFDACSPVLFGAVVTGKHLQGLTLTQEDGTGNVLLTVTLTNVFVTSWNIGGTVGNEVPAESVVFDFQTVCIQDAASSNTACFNKASLT